MNTITVQSNTGELQLKVIFDIFEPELKRLIQESNMRHTTPVGKSMSNDLLSQRVSDLEQVVIQM